MRAAGVRRSGIARRLPPVSEFAFAAVVAVVMSADVNAAAWPLPALGLTLAAGLSLAWRLTLPLVPLVLTCGVNALLLATAPGEFGPQTAVLGAMVAIYTAAAHLAGHRAVLASVLSLVLLWAGHIASNEGDVDDFFPLAIWAVPWIAGRLVRRQSLEARAAGARAALLEVEAREATSLERDRIARELHDVVGHAVSLMVVQAGAERMALGSSGSARTRAALASVEESGRQALVELRAMLGVLRLPDPIDERAPQPTLQSLPALVEQVRRAGLPVELTMDPGAEAAPGLALTAYRLVQEALTNTLRHAGPVPTVVHLDLGAELSVRITSDLPPGTVQHHEGRGLLGMRERVALHGGALSAGPDGKHWVVDARLPLSPALQP